MVRFQELDALRGVSIIMMVIFHFLFDINFFGIYKIALYEGFLLLFQRTIITTFLVVVGISLHISYARLEDKSFANILKKYFKRSVSLFAIALLITGVTYIYLQGNGFILWGIIHLIALSVLLAIFFFRFFYLNLFLGLLTIAFGFITDSIVVDFPYLLWLGVKFPNFYSVDYVPLIPWFGLVLVGLFFGKFLYPNGKRRFNIVLDFRWSEVLSYLGRNSLLIYIIHQPILIGLMYLFFF